MFCSGAHRSTCSADSDGKLAQLLQCGGCLTLTLLHLHAVQLQRVRAAINATGGDRAQISSIVKDAAIAGSLSFAGVHRLTQDYDALTEPTICLGEL